MREVCHERRPHLDEQRLQLGVLRTGNEGLVHRIEHGLVIRHLVVDVRLVERRARQTLEVRDVLLAPDFRLWLVGLSSGVTFNFVASATACWFTPV